MVNAGSSSLKLRLLAPDDALLASTDFAAPADAARVDEAIAGYAGVDAVGHRIVHGGADFTTAVRIDAAVEQRLQALVDLAPLHQPKSLAALDLVRHALPDVPHVACFDTAFHATMPSAASTYALPAEWRERWGLRRYGFHGISHAYASRRAASVVSIELTRLRLVCCHLGAGASLAAVRGGSSIDTTMGFTPLEGLVMATRSGSVDPGLLIWLADHAGIAPPELADALEHRSGLLALAGTADMRDLLVRTDEQARLALAVYIHRLRGSIAQMVAALGGVDVLVFTGGVGENAPAIRRDACEGLGHLGVRIDPDANRDIEGDGDVAAADAAVRVVVVRAREDLEIASQTRALLA